MHDTKNGYTDALEDCATMLFPLLNGAQQAMLVTLLLVNFGKNIESIQSFVRDNYPELEDRILAAFFILHDAES